MIRRWPVLGGALAATLLAAAVARAEPAADGAGGDAFETVVTVESAPADGPSVHKVRREEIERSGARSAAEVLEQEPAVHTTTGSRGERIFTLRGFEQRQVVVLIDGSPATIPYDGQVDLNMVPAELIDHVTLIKGPGSVLYGPNGMGGAVNIVTRRPGYGPLLETRMATGRGGAYELRGYHTHRLGPLAYAVHGGFERRDGLPLSGRFAPAAGENGVLRENSDQELYHVGGGVGLELAPRHRLEGRVTFINGSRGVPPSTLESVARFWRFTVWRALNVAAGHRGGYLGGALELDEEFFVSLFDNLLDSYDNATFSTQDTPKAFHSWYHDQIFGGRVRARYRTDRLPWGATDLRLWASLQHERHFKELDNEVEPARSRSIATFAPEVEAFVGERWRLLAACQLDVELPGAELDPTLAVGPLVSLRFDPRRDLLLRATVARRTRFPTLKERFSAATGYREPNPDLQPEGAWNIGVEGQWRATRWLTVALAGFDAEVQDLIERVYLGGGIDQLQNVGAARLAGAEIELKARVARWLALGAGYGFLHARRTDAAAGASDRLEHRPAHKLAFTVVSKPLRWLELSSAARVVGPQAFLHPETSRWGTLGTYLLWDARLDLQPLPWVEAYLSVRNLLDANYQTQYGFPDPGRQMWVGVRLRTG